VRGGQYTKIGRLVYFSGYLRVNSISSAVGSLLLGGFPFTSMSHTGTVFSVAFDTIDFSGDLVSGLVMSSDTEFAMIETNDNGAWTNTDVAGVSATDQVYFSGCYNTT